MNRNNRQASPLSRYIHVYFMYAVSYPARRGLNGQDSASTFTMHTIAVASVQV